MWTPCQLLLGGPVKSDLFLSKSVEGCGRHVSSLGGNQHGNPGWRYAGYQLRALLVHETFKKVLYLAPTARAEFSSGRVFNLVTSDAETLQVRTLAEGARLETCFKH